MIRVEASLAGVCPTFKSPSSADDLGGRAGDIVTSGDIPGIKILLGSSKLGVPKLSWTVPCRAGVEANAAWLGKNEFSLPIALLS